MTEITDYDVALSFAGEDRAQAEALARILADGGVRVFYDGFEKATARVGWSDDPVFSRLPCGDCAALSGQYHVPSCDLEECPACGGQAISCGCIHEPMTRERVKAWEEDEE